MQRVRPRRYELLVAQPCSEQVVCLYRSEERRRKVRHATVEHVNVDVRVCCAARLACLYCTSRGRCARTSTYECCAAALACISALACPLSSCASASHQSTGKATRQGALAALRRAGGELSARAYGGMGAWYVLSCLYTVLYTVLSCLVRYELVPLFLMWLTAPRLAERV